MAKRGAQSTLDHCNWNDAEEPEEVGEFTKASDDVIKQRVIKKARRRVEGDADSTAAASSSVFGGFKGFSSTPLPKPNEKDAGGAKTFSFLATLGANGSGNGATGVTSSGAVGSSTGPAKPLFSFGTNAGPTTTTDAAKSTFTFGSASGLKAPDSTDGAKRPATGFGISSTKNTDTDSSKNLFSFGTNPAKMATSIGAGAAGTGTFSFGSSAAKIGPAETDKKSFMFGSASATAAKDTATGVTKSTFSFGSLAAQSDKTDAGSPKTTFSFGKIPSQSDAGPAPAKSTFSFGSIPPKSDSAEAGSTTGSSPKSTFAFGRPSPKSEPNDAGPAKSVVSFASVPIAKGSDSTETKSVAATKSAVGTGTFSFGSKPTGGSAAPESGATKTGTFSFGSIPPKTESTGTGADKQFRFGSSPAPKENATDAEKKTFSFGMPPGSKPPQQNTTPVDKQSFFGAKKESAEDTVSKMFSFAVPAPKADSKDGEAGKKPFGVGFGTVPAKSAAPAVETSKVSPSNSSNLGTSFASRASSSKSPAVLDANETFNRHVVKLNLDFVEWVTLKVRETPCCKLQVVFRGYEKHFAQLETERAAATVSAIEASVKAKADEPKKTKAPEKEKEQEKEKPKPAPAVEKEKEKPSFSFGMPAKDATPAKPPTPVAGTASTTTGFTFGGAKPFSFGSSTSPLGAAKATPPTFGIPLSGVSTSSPSFFAGASSFGSTPSSTTGTTSLFGSASSTGGITFGNVSKPMAPSDGGKEADSGTTAEADEDEPPKVEFTPVEEKDSVYSKRCKLFVKVAGTFSDRGVGTLHIKQVDSKVQVILRAETSLGNILLNIILNESVPLQRMGKNNVMMVCLPTPDSKPPRTSVLLRVKTAEEADELHETLLRYKPK